MSLRSHCSVFKVQFLQKLVFPSFQWCSAENGGLKLESYNTFVAYMPLRVMNRCLIPLPFSFEKVVGSNGLEPSTSRLSGARSNHLSYAPISSGGDEEDRTPDPLLAKQVRSQLRYTPTIWDGHFVSVSESLRPSKLNNIVFLNFVLLYQTSL